ncbi:MAG: 4Fe-4S binding protein [Acholeplasma sp.]|jgi:NAD-dependent dihydropyrimidine dehydrogenase PreA subunit|nr:4Fe-4S binding protein [Acholeplasma sp.]
MNMPRWIDDSCIACGSCQAVCPVDCISEGDIYVIDEDVCIDCGACQEVCPVGAISER